MASNSVPQSYFTTTGEVVKSKNATGVNIEHFSLNMRLTVADGDEAIKHALPKNLPANAQVDHIHIHPVSASTIATGTSVGIGVTGDPNEYMEIAENNIDAVGENVTTSATVVSPSSAEKALFLHSTNGSGTGAGTIWGDWMIRITGRIIHPITA